MSRFRFELDKRSKKFLCINCGKKRAVRYIDTQTGIYLPEQYSRCDREVKCGYNLNPYCNGYAKSVGNSERPSRFPFLFTKEKETGNALKEKHSPTLPDEVMTHTLQLDTPNEFMTFLHRLFGKEKAEELKRMYKVGASSRWPGATVFWFVDKDGKIRAGQVKAFDSGGHTIKYIDGRGEMRSCTDWIHTVLRKDWKKENKPLPPWLKEYIESENKVSCMFGEHLLPSEPHKPIALVEAPKTAIIASVHYPQFVWLAAGGLSYLTEGRCKALKGRKVVMFPDLNAYKVWRSKAEKLEGIAKIKVSDILERVATEQERARGLDIGDYLVKHYHAEQKLP